MKRKTGRPPVLTLEDALLLLAVVTAGGIVAGLVVSKIVGDRVTARLNETAGSSPLFKLFTGTTA